MCCFTIKLYVCIYVVVPRPFFCMHLYSIIHYDTNPKPNDELLYNPDKNTEYLQHNCLSFQVKRVIILPNIVPNLPPWAVGNCLCQFTITSFTQFKLKEASFYSPPFYTNLRGYKLIVFVYASTFNCFNTTKGTCMSLHARLMKGEYDDTLAWPFSGDVVVEILNWREDKNQQEHVLP